MHPPKNLCHILKMESFNLEEIGVGKAPCHDPLKEVIFYKEELNRLL